MSIACCANLQSTITVTTKLKIPTMLPILARATRQPLTPDLRTGKPLSLVNMVIVMLPEVRIVRYVPVPDVSGARPEADTMPAA